jgi:hypothetical protein
VRWIHLTENMVNLRIFMVTVMNIQPVTVTERSKACTVFARLEAGILDSNPTQGMDVWYVYVFILCVRCTVEALQRADHSSKESYHL